MAHAFGGAWTERKLSVVRRYLEIYAQALKQQSFERIYIDAFAGTGDRTDKRRETLCPFLIFPSLMKLRKDLLASLLKSTRRFIAIFSSKGPAAGQ